ncbi:DNA polymerase III subunit delta [Propioniciclava soli]|uniref:DNA-directed DNA polymerase n=1 Tax=Propioniciclava soli TaxID=2775081 RepID=A0ABZ3C3R2_9ACTN
MEVTNVFGRVVLVVGPESLLAERAVDALVRDALVERPGASVNRVSAVDLDAGRLAEVTGGSLFASDTIVVVTDLADLAHDLVDTVASFATQPSDELALVLVHPGGNKGKGLLDRLKKAKVATRDCPTIKAWELPQFAVAEARALGGRLEAPTAATLVEAIGGDTRGVAAAVRQLIADSDDRHISETDVHRYFAGRADVTSFTVADHVMSGRRDEALGALRWALETGVPPVLVTSALASSLRSQGRYSDLAGARVRDAEVAQQVGVPPWKVKDLARHSRDWTPRGLASALQLVARADAAVKGAASDPAFALEQLVIGVAAQRGRRPEAGMGR